jgi:ubiquitin carboxyl-terminal hydrolase 15
VSDSVFNLIIAILISHA